MVSNRWVDEGRTFDCSDCGQTKKLVHPRQETCKKCLRDRRKRTCPGCGVIWLVKTRYTYKPRPEILSQSCPDCKRKSRKEVQQTLERFYVYGWYQEQSTLPFYVGKGSGGRAWRNELPAGCSVKIYRDGMTEEESYLVESVLIQTFTDLGAKLENRQAGRKKRSPF